MNYPNLFVNGNELRLGVEFSKVDKENRTVSGFATIDNIDSHGDVITAEASEEAFADWIARGNLREMHEHKAIGKVLSFEPREVVGDDGETYKGIWVTAYISKTEEGVWQKVLEGVYSGFSIGGRIIERTKGKVKDAFVNIISKYSLIELSLVDNPANPMANVLSIMKVNDAGAEGLIVETKVVNVHYDADGNTVVLSEDAEVDGFENIGWVEDAPGKGEAVKRMLQKYLDPNSLSSRVELVREAYWEFVRDTEAESSYVSDVYATRVLVRDGDDYYIYDYAFDAEGDVEFSNKREATVTVTVQTDDVERNADKPSQETVVASEGSTLSKATHEGGADMSDENKKVEKSADETVETTEEVVDEVTEEVEKAADVEEFEAEEFDADKFTADLTEKVRSAVEKALEKSAEATQDVQASFDEALAEVKKSVEEEVSSLKKEIDSLKGEVESLMDESAVKKSADVKPVDDDDEDDDSETSFWRGGFLGVDDLAKA